MRLCYYTMYDLLLLETTDRDVICHTHAEGRVLLIKTVLIMTRFRPKSYYQAIHDQLLRGTTGRDVSCHTLMEDILAKTVL